MLPRKIFENLHTVIVIFSAFRTIFRQSLFIFLALNFECFIKYDAFCKHSFDYAYLRQLRFIVMNRGANLC